MKALTFSRLRVYSCERAYHFFGAAETYSRTPDYFLADFLGCFNRYRWEERLDRPLVICSHRYRRCDMFALHFWLTAI